MTTAKKRKIRDKKQSPRKWRLHRQGCKCKSCVRAVSKG